MECLSLRSKGRSVSVAGAGVKVPWGIVQQDIYLLASSVWEQLLDIFNTGRGMQLSLGEFLNETGNAFHGKEST